MALNRKGERIQGLGEDFVVVPTSRWTDTVLFQEAYDNAVKSFEQSGALIPIRIEDTEIMVQEYPKDNKLLFLFYRQIRGRDHYYPFVFNLPPPMVAELRTIGRWGPMH